MITDLADAIAAAVNAAGYPASREYLPETELTDLTSPLYFVVPASEEATPAARAVDRVEYEIHVGILAKLTGTADEAKAQTDALILTARVIADALNPRNLPEAAGCRILAPVKIDPIYSPKHLREKRVFLSVIKLRAAEHRRPAG